MLTRETHARIYQGELSEKEYSELKSAANQKNLSLRGLVLEAMRKYLEDWEPRYSLDIEEVVLNDERLRFYLWLPYENLHDLDLLMASKGSYVQQLLKNATSVSMGSARNSW
jgi:hypothetical protein